nr:hypothetical protein [Tanacetum cinerariifolium]
MQDDEREPAELKEVIEVVTTTKLMTKVVTAAATIIVAPSAARRRKGVVIRDPEETATPSTIVHSEPNPRIKKKHFNSVVGFLEKSDKELEEEASKALKRKSEISEQQAAKKQKFDEEVPVVDYQIHTKNNKPYYKIIRADGTHQLFLSFLSFLRNFDIEDLEMLWKIFQERFVSSKLKNFSDKFLLTTLKAMFEKHDVEAHIWKNQRGIHGLAKVKSWKFFGVDAVEDFKEYALRDYYCWYKLKLLDNAADSRLRLLEQSAAADDKMKK